MIISAIGSFILAITLLTGVLSYNATQKTLITNDITTFIKNYTEDITNLFIEHPEMNYFYNEVFFNKVDRNAKRNTTLENQICMNIFTKTVEPLSTINLYDQSSLNARLLKELLDKMMTLFLQSPKIKNFYVNYYKKKMAGPLLTKYMQSNFGL
jgi:spore germination protein YaaH